MMPQRNNFRVRPDNRFRYPQGGRGGGRGGWNRPPGPDDQQKSPQAQTPKQQAQSKPNTNTNKPNVTNNTAANSAPSTKVASLMSKDTKPAAKQQNAQSPADKTTNQNMPAKTSNPNTPTTGTGHSGKSNQVQGGQGQGTQNRSTERGSGSNSGASQTQSNNRDQHSGSQGRGQQQDRRPHPTQRQDSGHNRGGQGRFHGGGGGGGGGNMNMQNMMNMDWEQPPQHVEPNIIELGDNLFVEERIVKKFTGRCRLFIGNLPNETTDDEFKKMFEKFGEINEVFLNKQKMFGFIRLDTRLNAEAAKNQLDGASFKGRVIRVRFAAHGAALKVKNLGPVISNELLEEAFSIFGEVERAIVIVDERGKSTAEGIVEFARKPAAQAAIKKIKEGVFLLTTSTRPICVEPLEQKNDEDGLAEKNVPKTPMFYQEREGPPRFAQRNSFEFEWGQRWKQLAEEEEGKRGNLELEIQANREKLLEEIELARHDYHTMQMRQELLQRQQELEHLDEQRKDLEVRRQGMQRHREERFPTLMTQESMMRQRQAEEMQARGESMDMQQAMRQEEMNRRESSQQQPQRTSRFDQPPASAVGFATNVRSSAGGLNSPSSGQQAGAAASNFGVGQAAGLASNAGGAVSSAAVGGANPRPLMDDELLEIVDRRGDSFGVNPKRARRF